MPDGPAVVVAVVVVAVPVDPGASTTAVAPLAADCEGEKYPTGNVGQGSVIVLLGSTPCTPVIGSPYTIPVATRSTGTVKVSCCPSAFVAMPMYVVVVVVVAVATLVAKVSSALVCAPDGEALLAV